jgi:predicted phosphodiesterase
MLSLALAATLVLSLLPLSPLQRASAADEEVVTLISNHESWRYSDTNTDLFGDPATDFRSASYDDSAWANGASPLGYPTTDSSPTFGAISAGGTLITKGAQGPSSSQAYVTYYFRKNFTVENIADITALSAKIAVDDGYVLYLNGREVSRLNMPDGTPTHATDAVGVWEPTEARANVTVDLAAYRQFLVEGVNTLAVDVHNRDANSSDIYWGLSLEATYLVAAPPADVNKTPRQVNVHVGDDPSDAVNVTYTTIATDDTKIVLNRADGAGEAITFTGESSVGPANKYVHKIPVTGLDANTDYEYTLGNEVTFDGSFKTAPEKGSQDSIRFIYLADTQVSNATNAEALGATLKEVANMDPDFVYLAGDITDTATSESQWEQMFTNTGSFPTGGEEMFGSYLIAAIQGNHDNNTFNRHINAPTLTSNSIENRVVYSYDYGPITFVMLNLETARADASARAEQESFLRAAVAEAKSRGQWTAVGFHKSLVTGASHVTDSDVIEARTFWCPKFAELDVDMVLQGHDHVYSRGFVNATGYKAERTVNEDGSINQPDNAPLYMVGGHAGGLKWYSLKNYTVGPGDPLAPGYSFLDVDSANPAHNADGIPSDVKQEQVIVEMTVSPTEVEVNTWMFKYDTDLDTITTPKYLYDSMVMRRSAPTSAEIVGPEVAVADADDEIIYTVAYNNITEANAFDTTIEYDSDVLELVRAESLAVEGNTVLLNEVSQPATNQVRVITGLETAVTQAGAHYVAQYVFKAKQPVTVNETTVRLVNADTVKGDGSGGYVDAEASIDGAEATTSLYSYERAADVNGDGKVTLADLAMALDRYQSADEADRAYDIDLSGVVDTLDFIIISSFIQS